MYALQRCLQYLTQHGTPRTVTIHSDNKSVVIGFHKGRLAMSYGELQAEWMPIFDALDNLTIHGWDINVIKVKGHITSEMIDRGEWQKHHKEGNDRADYYADLGATLNAVSRHDVKVTELQDARAWLMQERLLAIVRNRIMLNPTPKRNVLYDQDVIAHVRDNLDNQLERQEHRLIHFGHKTLCGCCQQVWHRQSRREILAEGPCPGPELAWGSGLNINPDIPSRLEVGAYPRYGRRPLHVSHNLSYIRGIVYCRTCGCYTSSQRVAKLAEPCRMKPRSATGAWQLRRMKDGLHPLGDAHRWPSLPAVPRELAPYLVHE